MACEDCPDCGGCSEPADGSPNSANCSPDAVSGYKICPWPALSGTGCLPGGNCNEFANRVFCLANVTPDEWRSPITTVDCTTTFGVVVDIQWVMTFDGSGNVELDLYAYLTGTSTVVATIVTYTGRVDLSDCSQPIRVNILSDGGQCENWPCTILINPLCCADCPSPPCIDPCCFSNALGQPAPAQAIIELIPACSPTESWPTDLNFYGDGTYCQFLGIKTFIPPVGVCLILAVSLFNQGPGPSNAKLVFSFTSALNLTEHLAEYVPQDGSFSCDPSATNVWVLQDDDIGGMPATVSQTWN